LKNNNLNLQFVLAASGLLISFPLSGCGGNNVASYESGGTKQTSRVGREATRNLDHLVYPGATAYGSQAGKEEGKDTNDSSSYLQLSSGDSLEKVAGWYENGLKRDGWNIERLDNMNKVITLEGNKKDTEIAVTLADDAGKTTIIITESTSIGAIPDDEAVENFKPNKEVPATD
jgi:hypothetical protein